MCECEIVCVCLHSYIILVPRVSLIPHKIPTHDLSEGSKSYAELLYRIWGLCVVRLCEHKCIVSSLLYLHFLSCILKDTRGLVEMLSMLSVPAFVFHSLAKLPQQYLYKHLLY